MMDGQILKGWCRGKEIDTGELVEGTPFYHKDGRVEIFDYKAVNSCWISAEGRWVAVVSDSVQMYSGFLDKNKKRAFEGDHVRCKGGKTETGTIVFEDGIFSVKWDDSEYGKNMLGFINDFEIVDYVKGKPKHDARLEEISSLVGCPYEDVEFVHGVTDDYFVTEYTVKYAKKYNIDPKALSSKLMAAAIGLVFKA